MLQKNGMQQAALVPETTVRAKVQQLVTRHGVAHVARLLGMSRHAVTALAGPAPVHAGTLALARERLATAPTLGVASLPPITA